ncbi:hypothetical protein BTN45_25205 (plasmid) [Rhizobium sp. ZX09]|nr:hypothetical protein BTN45_25205 [Rhizobium sp. ZX09]
MHRNGRNSVEDGKAVAWAPGSCKTAERDGPRQARLRLSLSTRKKAGAVGRQPMIKKKGRGYPRQRHQPKAAI